MIPALLLAAAVIISGAPSATGARLRRIWPSAPRDLRRTLSRPRLSRRGFVRVVAVAVGLSMAAWIASPVGIALGVASATLLITVMSRMTSRSDKRRQELLRRQSPIVVDLLAACMASGSTIHAAVSAVARAVDPPMAEELAQVERAISLGAPDPWAGLAPSALARAMRRSAESGAPLTDLLPIIAGEMRRDARLQAESAARSAGVRAVLPLVACFLPAFLLVGVVPVVASLARGLWT